MIIPCELKNKNIKTKLFLLQLKGCRVNQEPVLERTPWVPYFRNELVATKNTLRTGVNRTASMSSAKSWASTQKMQLYTASCVPS